VSDDEKAFLSALLQGLEKLLGISHISSTAYNSKAIAMLERSHLYLGECLRLLPVDQRPLWDTYDPQFEHGFNNVKCSTTTFTPFELAHGMPSRTVVSVLASGTVVDPLQRLQNDSKAVGIYGRIKESTKLYHRLAREATVKAKESMLHRLNASKKAPVTYEVGQQVIVYMPSRAITANWRPKHAYNWVGPMTVTAREAKVIYEVRENATGKVFFRHVTNMKALPDCAAKPDPLPTPSTPEVKASAPEVKASAPEVKADEVRGYAVGTTVAIYDEEDKDGYYLADVTKLIGESSAIVHFRGTTTFDVKRARFLPVHIERPSGLSILTARMSKRLLSPGCTSEPWTGTVTEEDALLYSVRLTKTGQLTAVSRRALAGYHHKVLH
jgi:hypothetical protein